MHALVRAAQGQLARWFGKTKRKPLIIRGARQVGKSTLVRQFAASQGLPLAEVNLEQHRRLEQVFARLQPKEILLELEATSGVSLAGPALLFLDELQATPSALPALRYLFEAYPDLPLIGAGSLLEFVLRQHGFSMPVGRVEYLHLGPMSFEEFLLGLHKEALLRCIQMVAPGEALPDAAHRQLTQLQREYLICGGLPEAVAVYAATHSLREVSEVQESVIATYKDDFAKYAKGSTALVRLQTIFDFVPGNIGRKIKYSHISREERARELRTALELLALARVILPVLHSDCSGLPLAAQQDPEIYKCLFLDVGLVNRVLGLDARTVLSSPERTLVNEGGLAEQFIGQHLAYREGGQREPSLHYWLREGKANNAEVDYVISHSAWIVPIEVKAGQTGSLKSLHQFGAAKDPPVMVRFDLGPASLGQFTHDVTRAQGTEAVGYRLLSLPLYLVGQLGRLLTALQNE